MPVWPPVFCLLNLDYLFICSHDYVLSKKLDQCSVIIRDVLPIDWCELFWLVQHAGVVDTYFLYPAGANINEVHAL